MKLQRAPQLPQASAESLLRSRYRVSVRQDTVAQRRRLRRRVAAALGTAAATALAVKYGGERAHQLFQSAQNTQMAAASKSGKRMLWRNMRGLKHFWKPRSREGPVEEVAMAGLGLAASELGKKAVRSMQAHPYIAGGTAGAAHLGGGTYHDVRKTRREQGRLARRMLLI